MEEVLGGMAFGDCKDMELVLALGTMMPQWFSSKEGEGLLKDNLGEVSRRRRAGKRRLEFMVA